MASTFIIREANLLNPVSFLQEPVNSLKVQPLIEAETPEVLEFLSQRPIHTVCMAGYIRDHGIVSPLNRGTFFGCRDRSGLLEGVALIGHATLLETHCESALQAFALVKHQYANSHLIRGEHEIIEQFWAHYSELGQKPRLACREVLLELESPTMDIEEVPALRVATEKDMEEIMRINSAMIIAECGVNPLNKDPEGFRQRLQRRIARGRVWVLEIGGKLIFKVDVFAETPQTSYLEGVYVAPQERGKGLGVRCLTQLNRMLLKQTASTCLFINEQRSHLANFYKKAGYRFRARYDTIYLQTQAS